MKFAVVAHRRSPTNKRGTGELERLAAGGVDVRNLLGSLVDAHDKLLTARALRLAGLPHPHTAFLNPALPSSPRPQSES